MTIGYRAILRLDKRSDALDVADRHLRDWLRGKAKRQNYGSQWWEWDGVGTYGLGGEATLQIIEHHDPREPATRRLYRFREENSHGAFVVSVYAISRAAARENQQSLMIETELEGVEADRALRSIKPPRLVGDILETEHATDGAVALTGAPEVIRRGDVDRVAAAIKDQDRTASVVVAASPGPEYDETWRDVVRTLTNDSVGVTSKYVVYDDAMDELTSALPSSHRVAPGQVRTFLPAVEWDHAEDGRRHRILGPQTLQRSLERRGGKMFVAGPLQKRHAEVARRRSVERTLPPDLDRTMKILRRDELEKDRQQRVRDRLAASAVRTEPVPVITPDTGRVSEVDPKWVVFGKQLLRRWLGKESADPKTLKDLDHFIDEQSSTVSVAEEQLQEAAEREDELYGQLKKLQASLEDLELEAAEVEDERSAAAYEVTELRRRLIEAGQHDTYVVPVDELWKTPENMEELVARISGEEVLNEAPHPATTYIEFTGDSKEALEIDSRDDLGRFATALWDYIKVLHDYAGLKCGDGFRGGLHAYLTDENAPGHKCSPQRHAARESDSVENNSSWRAERVRPVPTLVDPSGELYMGAHFKPTRSRSVAPRMHYYDDLDNTGKIYVGYIGMHLTNTLTN